MADQSIRVENAIKTESDCRERVAFDLMTRISYVEESPKDKGRDYYLNLYAECLHSVNGWSLKAIQKER